MDTVDADFNQHRLHDTSLEVRMRFRLSWSERQSPSRASVPKPLRNWYQYAVCAMRACWSQMQSCAVAGAQQHVADAACGTRLSVPPSPHPSQPSRGSLPAACIEHPAVLQPVCCVRERHYILFSFCLLLCRRVQRLVQVGPKIPNNDD